MSLHFNIDSRFQIGRAWRISPRIRVDYRKFNTDGSEQWIYTPGTSTRVPLGQEGQVRTDGWQTILDARTNQQPGRGPRVVLLQRGLPAVLLMTQHSCENGSL